MPISIQCPQCQRSYRVDEKLSGQKVRCRDCGATIEIPGEAPMMPTETGAAGGEGGAGGVPDLRSLFGAPVARKAAEGGAGVNFLDASDVPLKNRRWVRKSGSPTLEMADSLVKSAGFLVIAAGIVIWVIHLYKTVGISVAAILPMVTVLVGLAGVLSPAVAFAINKGVRAIKLAPRDDTYGRVAVAVLLPLAAGMIAGLPGAGDSLAELPFLAWLISPALLIYFFRAEMFEWIVSIGGAVVGLGIGLIGMMLLSLAANSWAGPLYVDMLPAGPWEGMAKGGHLPVVASAGAPAAHPSEAAPAETQAENGGTAQASTGAGGRGVQGAGGENQGENGRGESNGNTGLAGGSAMVSPIPQPAGAEATVGAGGGGSGAGGGGASTKPAVRVAVSRDLHSPFLTDVIPEERGLTDVTGVVTPVTPTGSMLVVRNGDGQVKVEKWDAYPPVKKAEAGFPLFPKKASEYMLSPRGDYLAAMAFFPRSEIEIVSFDGKTPRKNATLDVPDATASLLGFMDDGHFYVRWDPSGASGTGMVKLQQWSVLTGQSLRPTPPLAAMAGDRSTAISANGRMLAAFEPGGQLAIYTLETGALQRRIHPSDLPFDFYGLAFSPDGNQIAVYGVLSDVPTVMAFRIQSGAPQGTAVVAAADMRGKDDAMKRRLIWLADSAGDDLWLVDGNELADAVTGRKIGSLGLSGVVDQAVTGNSTMEFELPGSSDGTENVVVARLDDQAIHEAAMKGR